MTLIGSILRKVRSTESLQQKYPSPPPETIDLANRAKGKKKFQFLYSHVGPKVDCKPPFLDLEQKLKKLYMYSRRFQEIHEQNMKLLGNIKRMHFTRGEVDSHWRKNERSPPIKVYFEKRVKFYKRVYAENQAIYKRLMNAVPRVDTAEYHRKEWKRLRQEILIHAQAKFVLFDPIPTEVIEDPAFIAPPDVKRPRATLTLRVRNGAFLGRFHVELFTDVCPATCQLFLQLLDGDPSGYGYVGTTFFRKAPGLFWSGGDVVYNNGFGCFAQRGRITPIGAENYHFSHSMPGLLSMRVTRHDEMCGIFSITYKRLPQLDLKSVVFGRVIRPSDTYDVISRMGSAMSTQPLVDISSSQRRHQGNLIKGKSNTRLKQLCVV